MGFLIFLPSCQNVTVTERWPHLDTYHKSLCGMLREREALDNTPERMLSILSPICASFGPLSTSCLPLQQQSKPGSGYLLGGWGQRARAASLSGRLARAWRELPGLWELGRGHESSGYWWFGWLEIKNGFIKKSTGALISYLGQSLSLTVYLHLTDAGGSQRRISVTDTKEN